MKEKAVVIKNRADRAKVEITPSSACSGCKGCSIGKENKPVRVWAKNLVNAKEGQAVEVEISVIKFLSATTIVYGFPLLAFLAGVVLGYIISDLLKITLIEPFALLTGIVSMLACYLGIHHFTKNELYDKKYTSDIIRILD